MNVSPHHQRPTRYPWPGRASGLAIVVAVVVIAIVAFILVADPFGTSTPDPSAMRFSMTAAL